MNGYEIVNVSDTTFEEGDAINYRIFQQEILNVRNLINEVLPLDGTKPMTGNPHMGGKEIVKMKPVTVAMMIRIKRVT